MENEIIKTSQKTVDSVFGTFLVGDLEVAINVKAIQEVVNFPENIVKMPLAPSYLVGIFNLRGMIIPIINLKALLQFGDIEVSTIQKIGIIDYQGAKVGLLFDSTNQILRVDNECFNEFRYSVDQKNQVICGAIKLDGGRRLVQVIDPFSLVSVENIPQITDLQKNRKVTIDSQLHKNRRKCISFRVNESILGFEMSGIQEIIRVPELQRTPRQSECCLGVVNLRGQTVPVIDFAHLLGSANTLISEIHSKRIIVLKVENELFGLLVDSVESINSYLADDIMPIPIVSRARAKMFQGCISVTGLGEVILLNQNEVLNDEEILKITEGHSKIYSSQSNAGFDKKRNLNKQVYISFKLDHLFGLPIKDVREIINYTEEITITPGLPPTIKGILNLRGKLVTIIDTRLLYKLDSKSSINETKAQKILIFDIGDDSFGLIVDSLESIITVDDDKKTKVPEIMSQKVRHQFENDIKEIVTIQQAEQSDRVLIILNVMPVISRIKDMKTA
ncbi:MAG: chemotaxis protein CheW [Pseudobdellovibrionaceae bacterium]